MRKACLAAAAVAMVAVAAPAADAKPLKAKIQRTKYGVPHITAKNIKGLAAGFAYAFAQDNICTIAAEYVTVNAERSRFFGPDETWFFSGNGSTYRNLDADFYFQWVKQQEDGRGADRQEAAGRPEAGRSQGRPRIRARLQQVPARQGRRPTSRTAPAAARSGSGRSSRSTSTGASTSSAFSRARARSSTGSWARRPSPRPRRRLGTSAARRDVRDRRGAPAAPAADRLERIRLRPRGHGQRARPRARQPALPVGRVGAALPGPPPDPGQDRRRRRDRSTACR